MNTDRAKIARTIVLLNAKADACADLAKEERQSADRQHHNAHQLEAIGVALDASAATLAVELAASKP